jgi:putative phosphoribosyl transferase
VDRQTAQLRFDIPFLANRLVTIAQWLGNQPRVGALKRKGCGADLQTGPEPDRAALRFAHVPLKIGYFGASTGAGAALVAASELPRLVHCVVSRGGRLDLAADALERVQAPTLAIVGGNDRVVADLNREALARMKCVKVLHVIPGAGHLFEEAGALEEVAKLARAWFAKGFFRK